MKDLVDIGHLIKYDAHRDKVMDLEIRFKIHTNVSNFEMGIPPLPSPELKNTP